jgi:pyruvate kinase
VRRCRKLEVPCIVATGLLLSMQQGPFPSRAEVSDVAAALAQGADSLMLSDETSNGKDPVAAAKMLAALIAEYGPGKRPCA